MELVQERHDPSSPQECETSRGKGDSPSFPPSEDFTYLNIRQLALYRTGDDSGVGTGLPPLAPPCTLSLASVCIPLGAAAPGKPLARREERAVAEAWLLSPHIRSPAWLVGLAEDRKCPGIQMLLQIPWTPLLGVSETQAVSWVKMSLLKVRVESVQCPRRSPGLGS